MIGKAVRRNTANQSVRALASKNFADTRDAVLPGRLRKNMPVFLRKHRAHMATSKKSGITNER
jgi:hypothetical protein